MIIEIILPLIVSTACAGIAALRYHSVGKSLEKGKQANQIPFFPLETYVQLSLNVELVVELLKSDEGWTTVLRTETRGAHKLHETGVRVFHHTGYGQSITKLEILDSEGTWVSERLSGTNEFAIVKELEAFNARAKDRRDREVTRALAERIVKRANGEVLPLLGGPYGNGRPPADEDDASPPATTGLLSYDAKTKQVVASERGDSVRLQLDSRLERRYCELIGKSRYDRSNYMTNEEVRAMMMGVSK